MNNRLIDQLVGKKCTLIYANATGTVKGTVQAVENNWLQVQTKESTLLVNVDRVAEIRTHE